MAPSFSCWASSARIITIYLILSSTNWKARLIYSLSALSPKVSDTIWSLSFNFCLSLSKAYRPTFLSTASSISLLWRLINVNIVSIILSSIFFSSNRLIWALMSQNLVLSLSTLRVNISILSVSRSWMVVIRLTSFYSLKNFCSIIYSMCSSLRVMLNSKLLRYNSILFMLTEMLFCDVSV